MWGKCFGRLEILRFVRACLISGLVVLGTFACQTNSNLRLNDALAFREDPEALRVVSTFFNALQKRNYEVGIKSAPEQDLRFKRKVEAMLEGMPETIKFSVFRENSYTRGYYVRGDLVAHQLSCDHAGVDSLQNTDIRFALTYDHVQERYDLIVNGVDVFSVSEPSGDVVAYGSILLD